MFRWILPRNRRNLPFDACKIPSPVFKHNLRFDIKIEADNPYVEHKKIP
jgi:hypothetical protein